MTIDLDIVESMVAKAGLELNRSSVSELSEQGGINRVFRGFTDVGEVVIHLGKRLDQDTHNKSKPRIYGVSEFLRETEIPCAEVYYHGTTADNRWFVVQERLDGQPVRNVASPEVYFDEISELLARLHSIETDGHGLFEYQNGDLFDPHETWLSYLKQRRTESMDMIGDVLAESRRKKLD